MYDEFANEDCRSLSYDDFNDEYYEEDYFSFSSNNIKNQDESTNSKSKNEKKENEIHVLSDLFSFDVNVPQNQKISFNIPETFLFYRRKFRKRKLNLSNQAQKFQNYYYLIFTNKKKFPKEFIQKIHKIIQEPLNLKPMVRDVVRRKDKYFEEYVNDSKKIIEYLVLNKQKILMQIPELMNY